MTVAQQSPQPPPPTWNLTAQEIEQHLEVILEKCRAVHDKVSALPADECTFDSVFRELGLTDAYYDATVESLKFYQYVALSSEVRQASNRVDVAADKFKIEKEMRVDLFNAMKNAAKQVEESGETLSLEDRRLMERYLRDGRRAGLDLPAEKREKLSELLKEIAAGKAEFKKNCNEEKGTIAFTLEELKGVPADVISGFNKRAGASPNGEDLYDVTFRTPDIFPVFQYAVRGDTRSRAFAGYEGRVPENVEVFEKVMDLRRRAAAILGYPTWADFVTEKKMVKTSKNVIDFIADVEQKIRQLAEKELQHLRELKSQEEGVPVDAPFWVSDYRFYDRLDVERSYKLDQELVKQYFPVEVVVPAIMDVYKTLLGVKFQEMSNDLEKGEVWHKDVQRFSVWEDDEKEESQFIGYMYLDIYPREGKYSHAAMWQLVPGYEHEDGSWNYPVASMVANLAKPTPERPALMPHNDVVTFFHEMGHVFHGLLSRTKYAKFYGTEVAGDFVEAPSQMLENWCFVPKVLEKMSSHYKTKEPLPADLIKKIVDSRFVNIGLFSLRQLFFGRFDITVHTSSEAEDYTLLWEKIRLSTSLMKGPEPLVAGHGTFAHLFNDYDAGYYGYMYSLVFAADMYETVFSKDPLSRDAGRRYRKEILEAGSARDESESLKAFLGREPNSDAFLKQLLGTSAPKGTA